MDLSFEEIIRSPTITFKLGEQQEPVFVHKAPIAALSDSLDALLNGRMVESQQGVVEWPDVTVQTFARFSNFAYSGDYANPEPTVVTLEELELDGEAEDASPAHAPIKEAHDEVQTVSRPMSESEPEAATQVQPINGWDRWVQPNPNPFKREARSKKTRKVKKAEPVRGALQNTDDMREGFSEREYQVTRSAHQFFDICQPHGNEDYDSFESVLMAHAELYVLADKHFIEALRMLTLEKIHTILTHFVLRETNIKEIMNLVEYVYDNTPGKANTSSGVDQLRDLLNNYIATEIVTREMGHHKAFLDLFGSAGDFTLAVWDILYKKRITP